MSRFLPHVVLASAFTQLSKIPGLRLSVRDALCLRSRPAPGAWAGVRRVGGRVWGRDRGVNILLGGDQVSLRVGNERMAILS